MNVFPRGSHALPLAALALLSCSQGKMIPGTQILDQPRNREVVEAIEKYRRAMEDIKIPDLMAMAHRHYYEHSGTPSGKDDYGYQGLLRVIRKRLGQVVALRCSIKYLRIRWPAADQAEVEIYISASFQLKSGAEESWHRMTDYNKMVLVKERSRWQFLRGM
jgi:hypothetical protein